MSLSKFRAGRLIDKQEAEVVVPEVKSKAVKSKK